MASIDLRECLNAVSDAVNNRPTPIREFDQIYMKTADMLLHTEHVGRCLDGKRVVCVGDGDAIGICLIHLHNLGHLEHGPSSVHVLDFDERIVGSVVRFARRFDIEERLSAELYNVVDPLPVSHWQAFEGFHTNPPFGASNDGKSVEAFVQRGIEATGAGAVACVVVADHPDYPWTQEVLSKTQEMVIEKGFVISELVPRFHRYHLPTCPELTSCTMAMRRAHFSPSAYNSESLDKSALDNFYGEEDPLKVRYVRDKTGGGKRGSGGYELEPLDLEA